MNISLTDSAKKRFGELIKTNSARGIYLGVKKSGCAGLTYKIDLDYDGHFNEVDWHIIDQGVTLFVHEADRAFLDGMTIDWQTQGINQRVVFLNPNERSSCGCGESFSV